MLAVVPRSIGPSVIVASVESVPLLAMSYWEAVGFVLLQLLGLPFGGRHSP